MIVVIALLLGADPRQLLEQAPATILAQAPGLCARLTWRRRNSDSSLAPCWQTPRTCGLTSFASRESNIPIPNWFCSPIRSVPLVV